MTSLLYDKTLWILNVHIPFLFRRPEVLSCPDRRLPKSCVLSQTWDSGLVRRSYVGFFYQSIQGIQHLVPISDLVNKFLFCFLVILVRYSCGFYLINVFNTFLIYYDILANFYKNTLYLQNHLFYSSLLGQLL